MKKEVGILVVATVFVSFLSTGCEDKIELKTFSADPPEFSPDGDGVADTTKLTVGAQASVTDAHFKDSAMTFSESVYIEVKDQAGNLVSTSSQTQPLDRAGALKQGSLYVLKTPKMDYVWNGKLPDGTYAPDGDYSASASAKLIGTKNGTPSQLDASEVKTTTVSVKKTSPLIIGVTPGDGSRILYHSHIQASIALSGKAASVKLNGMTPNTRRGNNYTFDYVPLKKGINALNFEATDSNGVVSTQTVNLESIQRCPDGIVKPEEGGIVDVVDPASPIKGATAIIYVNALPSQTKVELLPAYESEASSKGASIPVGTPVKVTPENTVLTIPADLFLPFSKDLFEAAESVDDELLVMKEGTTDLQEAKPSELVQRPSTLNVTIDSFGTYVPVVKNQTNLLSFKLAGGGETVPGEDGHPAEGVKFDKPIKSIKADKSGNLFVLQENKLLHMNLESKVVRKLLDASSPGWQATKAGALAVNARGTKLFIAFNGGYIQSFGVVSDGTPTGATTQENGTDGMQAPADGLHIRDVRFLLPNGIAVFGEDELVVVDSLSGRVFRVDANQRIRTVAGAGLVGKNEDSPHPATEEKLTFPSDMEVAVIGKAAAGPNPPTKVLLFADSIGNRVRAVNIGDYEAEVFGEKLPPGYITTVAGKKCVLPGWLQVFCGGASGDGGPAKQAHLKRPVSVSYDEDKGRLFVSDTGNGGIRVVAGDGRITRVAGGNATDVGMAREAGAENIGGMTIAKYAISGPDYGRSYWNLAWIRDTSRIAVTANGLVVSGDKSNQIGEEIKFSVTPGYKSGFTPVVPCYKVVCGHSTETMSAPGACGLKSAPSHCKKRTNNYYSSSTNYNLRQDLPEVPTFRYTRKSPGRDKWKVESFDQTANTMVFKDVYTTAVLPQDQRFELKGIDLGTTPFDVVPGEARAAYGLLDAPDDPKCGFADQTNCTHKIHGSRKYPIDFRGTLRTNEVGDAELPTLKFLDVAGTHFSRDYLFKGTDQFEGFVKRAVKAGFNTISLQIRTGISKVVTDAVHTDLVYFIDPCESQTPEEIERFMFKAKEEGITNFMLEFIAKEIYQRVKPVTVHEEQYLFDWFGYGSVWPSNAEKVHCWSSAGSGHLSDIGDEPVRPPPPEIGYPALSAPRLMNGRIKLTYPDVTVAFSSGSFTSNADYTRGHVFEPVVDGTECEKQADARIFNYRCLLKFWASKAQRWSEGGVHITISMANDYYEIVNFLAKNDSVVSEIKSACPLCDWTVAPFTVSMVPGQLPDGTVDPVQAEREVNFLRSLSFIGTNPGMHAACVDDLNVGQSCSTVARVPNDDLFVAFGEKRPTDPGSCKVFESCAPFIWESGWATFWNQTGKGFRGCYCTNGYVPPTPENPDVVQTCVNTGVDGNTLELLAGCKNGSCVAIECGAGNIKTADLCSSSWEYCHGPGDSKSPAKMMDPPFDYLHTNLSSTIYNNWAVDQGRLLRKLEAYTNTQKFALLGISNHFYELGVYNPSGGIVVKSTENTNLADHQEQIDYVEAMVSSFFEEYKPLQGDSDPWILARVWNRNVCNGDVCQNRRRYALSGIKSNFDELTYIPMSLMNEPDFCRGSCRSYWNKPYSEYLKLLFGE